MCRSCNLVLSFYQCRGNWWRTTLTNKCILILLIQHLVFLESCNALHYSATLHSPAEDSTGNVPWGILWLCNTLREIFVLPPKKYTCAEGQKYFCATLPAGNQTSPFGINCQSGKGQSITASTSFFGRDITWFSCRNHIWYARKSLHILRPCSEKVLERSTTISPKRRHPFSWKTIFNCRSQKFNQTLLLNQSCSDKYCLTKWWCLIKTFDAKWNWTNQVW